MSFTGICSGCGRHNADLRCGRCEAVFYCGVDCQRMHWNQGHKRDCFPPGSSPPKKSSFSSPVEEPQSVSPRRRRSSAENSGRSPSKDRSKLSATLSHTEEVQRSPRSPIHQAVSPSKTRHALPPGGSFMKSSQVRRISVGSRDTSTIRAFNDPSDSETTEGENPSSATSTIPPASPIIAFGSNGTSVTSPTEQRSIYLDTSPAPQTTTYLDSAPDQTQNRVDNMVPNVANMNIDSNPHHLSGKRRRPSRSRENRETPQSRSVSQHGTSESESENGSDGSGNEEYDYRRRSSVNMDPRRFVNPSPSDSTSTSNVNDPEAQADFMTRWRGRCEDERYIREADMGIDNFLTMPIPDKTLACGTLLRKTSGEGSKRWPVFQFQLEGAWNSERKSFDDEATHLLWAKRRRKGKNVSYLLGTSLADLEKREPIYLGKLKANYGCSEFILYNDGAKTGERGARLRKELLRIRYTSHKVSYTGPRQILVILPEDANGEKYMYVNKLPEWNKQTKTHSLKFYGRASKASVKNFCLIRDGARFERSPFAILHGKREENVFSLDFRAPISPLLAFGVALSSFESSTKEMLHFSF